jgi:hypothetical protein
MILRSDFLLLGSISVLLASARAAETRSSESSRPRGVGPECKKRHNYFAFIFLSCSTDMPFQLPNSTDLTLPSPISSLAYQIPPSSSPSPASTTTIATALTVATSLAPQPVHTSPPSHQTSTTRVRTTPQPPTTPPSLSLGSTVRIKATSRDISDSKA